MCLWLIIADMIQTESLRDMNKAQDPVGRLALTRG